MDDHRLTARDRQKLLTRARVVDAARALFAEKGYEEATIRDIAARAGVAPGSVFTTFETKADLLLDIVFSRYMTLAEALSFPAEVDDDPMAQLITTARLAYGYELQEPRLLAETIGASWTWSTDAEFENRRRLAPLAKLIERILARGAASGRFRPDLDVGLMSDAVFGVFVLNFRSALFDGEDASALTARFAKQMQQILTPVAAGDPAGSEPHAE
jgi:AcrR family transcriptional regulator